MVNNDISDVDVAAAMAFIAKGGLLTVATGRLRDSAKRFVDTLGVNCPAICQNGGYIYDFQKNEEISSTFLHNRAYDITREIIERYPSVRLQIFSHQKVYCIGYGQLWTNPARYIVMVESIKDIPRPWAKVLFDASSDILDKIRTTAKELDITDNFEFVKSSDFSLEILPKGINKGMAVTKLAKQLGISREMTIAIGDNENDIEMIQAAGVGLAVKGACPPVADAADLVLPYGCGTALFGTIQMLKKGEIQLKSKGNV